MDSEWRKPPSFIYGKVLESPEYSRREWDRASWAGPPRQAAPGRPARQAESVGEGGLLLPPGRIGEGEESLLPTPSGVFSFLSDLASWSLNWFGLET